MPKIIRKKECFDKIFYDTHLIEPGQQKDFFTQIAKIGNLHDTNLEVSQQFSRDMTATVVSFGLRLIGKSQDEEDRLLDHFLVTPFIGDKPVCGTSPGSVFNTTRYIEKCNICRSFSPGYIIKAPVILWVRQKINVLVQASPMMKEAHVVRIMTFTLETY